MEITVENIRFSLERASLEMIQQKDHLARLDAAIGDGDLGVTVELGCRALVEAFRAVESPDLGVLLTSGGRNFARSASSTFGILIAAAFIEAGKAVSGKCVFTPSELARIARSVVDSVHGRGHAEVGDKTMLDVIIPALAAFEQGVLSGLTLKENLDQSVQAAEVGLRSTIPLKSKYGRAAWMGEKSIGVQDAGATAVYLFLDSFVKHLKICLNKIEST